MEIQLRMVLLGVGVLILLVVGYDFFKRKSIASIDSDVEVDRPKRKYLEDYVEPDIYEASAVADDVKLYAEAEFDPISSDVPTTLQDDIVDYDYEEGLVDPKRKEDDTTHIITLTVMARDPYGFLGDRLLSAFESAGLTFANNGTFQRFEEDDLLFTVVNAMEPGYFMLETLTNEHVPGITLILLPEKIKKPMLAYDKLIRTAKQIAFTLNGEILDHFKLPLTLETIDQYRREVEAVTKRK